MARAGAVCLLERVLSVCVGKPEVMRRSLWLWFYSVPPWSVLLLLLHISCSWMKRDERLIQKRGGHNERVLSPNCCLPACEMPFSQAHPHIILCGLINSGGCDWFWVASPSDLLLLDQGLVQDPVTHRASVFGVYGGVKEWDVPFLFQTFCFTNTEASHLPRCLLSVPEEADAIGLTWPQKYFSSYLWPKSLQKGYITIYCLAFYIHLHVISMSRLLVQSSSFPDLGIQ